jgi:hypothetical protein
MALNPVSPPGTVSDLNAAHDEKEISIESTLVQLPESAESEPIPR